MNTGYWGVPGGGERAVTKTHVESDERPLCGARLRAGMQFQFCSAGVYERYIECRSCLKIARRLIEAQRAVESATRAIKKRYRVERLS